MDMNVSQMIGQTSYTGTTGTVNNTQPTIDRSDTFSQIGNFVGTAAAGGAASFKFSASFSSSLKSTMNSVHNAEGFGNKMKASLPGVKEMGMTSLKAGGIGAIISGAVSAITNGVEVLQGKKTGAEAVGTFAADTASGTVGAMAGVATGGLATMALGSMLGTTPLMIVGVGVGALAAVAADKLFKGIGAYDGLRNSVKGMMGQN